MGFSEQIKSSVNGDEYYTPQEAVDMILPYLARGGIKTSGARSTKKRVTSLEL